MEPATFVREETSLQDTELMLLGLVVKGHLSVRAVAGGGWVDITLTDATNRQARLQIQAKDWVSFSKFINDLIYFASPQFQIARVPSTQES